MMFFNRNRKGQSTLEYAVLIAGVVGAVLIFAPYLQRVAQGRLKESSDRVGYRFGGETEESIEGAKTAWEETGDATNTVTTEVFSPTTGNIVSTTTTAEIVTRKEADSWGTATEFETFTE